MIGGGDGPGSGAIKGTSCCPAIRCTEHKDCAVGHNFNVVNTDPQIVYRGNSVSNDYAPSWEMGISTARAMYATFDNAVSFMIGPSDF